VTPAYALDFWPVLLRWLDLVDGIWLSLLLSAVGILGGTALGILGALGRTSPMAPVRWGLRAYIELFRNTPLLVQLFLVYLGLPSVGIRLSPVMASCVALVLNNAAYTTEIVRAGIAATPSGQIEAARSLALRPWQILAFIVVRPALARIYPALVSQNVLLMLSTGITSAIGVQELTAAASDINSDTFRSLEAFLVAGALYLVLNYLIRLVLWAAGLWLFPNRRLWAA
jgi:polar amino acid transport system permease protein